MRNPKCLHYGDCLAIAAIDNKNLECDTCQGFSKWKNILLNGQPKEKEEIMDPKTKICRKCEREKSIDEFGPLKASADGHEYSCRKCKSDYQKELRIRHNREKVMGTSPQPPVPKHKSNPGNGRRRKVVNARNETRIEAIVRKPSPSPSDALYLPPEAIKAIRRALLKDFAQDFSKFIEEKYA